MTNWQNQPKILEADEPPVFEPRDLHPDYIEDEKEIITEPVPQSPLTAPQPLVKLIDSIVAPSDYIILKDEPVYQVLVSKYRLGMSPEVEKATKTLGLTLQNTAKEQNGRDYIGNIKHEQALNLNSALNSFTLSLRYFIDFLSLLKSKNAYQATGKKIPEEELLDIYEEITKVRSPWRSEWLDASFSMQGKILRKRLHITHNKINPDGTLQKVTEQLDDDTLMENKTPGIDLDQLVTNANSQGLPKANIPAGNLYYWCPADGRVARFSANSDWAVLDCFRGASNSDAELGVRRAILLKK